MLYLFHLAENCLSTKSRLSFVLMGVYVSTFCSVISDSSNVNEIIFQLLVQVFTNGLP